MKIQPFSQKIIESGTIRADGLISIRCKNTKKPNINASRFSNNILYLSFDDIAVQKYTVGNGILYGPTDTDIHICMDFIDRLGSFNFLAVHCHAGLSRSPAIATLLYYYMAGDPYKSITIRL